MQDLTKRQEEIIQTSVRIIDQRGIQGLTIKNLSKELGITEGAIYRHFNNKREILSSILIQFKDNLKAFADSIDDNSLTTHDKISGILNHFRNIFEANPAIVSVIFAEEIFQNDNELSKVIAEILRNNQHFLLAIIKEGQQSGELRKDLNPQMMVDSIFGPFRLLVKKWKMEGFDISLKESIDEFLQYLRVTIFEH
jgi:AcrR family transcriptional regulator